MPECPCIVAINVTLLIKERKVRNSCQTYTSMRQRRDMLLQGTRSVAIPEEDWIYDPWHYRIVHTCSKRPQQVGNCREWWWSRKILSGDLPNTIKLLDLGKRYNVHLSEEKLTTVSEEIGTWGWHVHVTSKSSKKKYMLPGTKYFSTVSVRDGW